MIRNRDIIYYILASLDIFYYLCQQKPKTFTLMKRLLLSVTLALFAILQCNATDYYLYQTTRNVNLRESPFADSEIICVIPKGCYVMVTKYENVNFESGLAPTLYIDEDINGWAATRFMKFIREIEVDENGVFTKTGTYYGIDPELNITNTTNRNITVSINGMGYPFEPGESRSITCEAGTVSVLASSPGVIPYVGKDFVEENSVYRWNFYIKTTYR